MRFALSATVAGEVPHDRALSDDDRQMLTIRVKRIEAWLAPAEPASIADEVQKLFLSMASRTRSDLDVEMLVRIYINDLNDLPLWAISKACEQFRRGEVGDAKWAPTQAEIRQVAVRLTANVMNERDEAQRVLSAKVLPPAEKVSIRGAADRLLAEMAHPDPLDKRLKIMPDARGITDPKAKAAAIAANEARTNQLKAEYAANPIEASPYLRAQAKARAEASEARAASFGQV